MAQLNLSLPSFHGMDLSDEKQMRKLTSYLYRLDEQLRYVLNNLGEENLSDSLRAIINAQTDATVLDEMTGRLQRLGTQITQTADKIKLAASKEELDALGNVLNESVAAFEVTAEEIRLAVEGKLDADAPSVGVQTASAVVNEKGVYLSGGEIDMRTTDGENFVNITDGGVEASRLRAPDVMPKYAGPTVIYVNPLATSEEIEAGATYRSLKEALETIGGRFVPYGVTMMLADGMTEYDDVFLKNAVFPAGLTVTASYDAHAKLMGQFSVSGCSGKLTVQFLDIQTHDGVNGDGFRISGSGIYARLEYCVIRGDTGGDAYGVYAAEGANVYAAYCDMYDCRYALYGNTTSRCVAINNKGNCTICASMGSDVSIHGSAPSANAAQLDAAELIGGRIRTQGDAYIFVDQGSGGSTPSTPVIAKLTSNVELTRSYKASGSVLRNDPAQGWLEDAGSIKGCIWFHDFYHEIVSGKNVLSATIRLHMKSSGHGHAVAVELYGIRTASTSNTLELGNSYGTVKAKFSPGETAQIELPAQALLDISSGVAKGYALYNGDAGGYKGRFYSENYAVFTGSDGDDDKRPMLTVMYEG
jgi:hypothetical protein